MNFGRGRGIVPLAIASVISVLWLAGALILFFVLGTDGALWLAIAVAFVVPLVLIWLAALVAREMAGLREAARQAEVASPPISAPELVHTAPSPPPAPGPKYAAAPTAPVSRPPPRPAPPPPPQQPSLPLPVEMPDQDIALAVIIRALDFPESPDDTDGFRALRMAVRNPRTRRIVQAAQDILTLLGEEGVYMDDFGISPVQAGLWRRFASGERGAAMAALAGVAEESALTLTGARMKGDPVFRDVAHHFLRLFDRTLTQIASEATDDDIVGLINGRTGRAFMLIGKTAGIFD